MWQLDIYDLDHSGILDVDLITIINVVMKSYNESKWTVMNLEITTHHDSGYNVLEVEEECKNKYKQYDTNSLIDLISNVTQIINGTFNASIEICGINTVIISVVFIDSTFVSISSSDENLLRNIAARYNHVEWVHIL